MGSRQTVAGVRIQYLLHMADPSPNRDLIPFLGPKTLHILMHQSPMTMQGKYGCVYNTREAEAGEGLTCVLRNQSYICYYSQSSCCQQVLFPGNSSFLST